MMALLNGKIVVYPTDTSYGLACDPANKKGLEKFYAIKGRPKTQPIHVIPPIEFKIKSIVQWNDTAQKLAQKFWPGPVTLVLPLHSKFKYLRQFCSKDGFLGLRIPNAAIALSLASKLGRPIPATSANTKGEPDCYSVNQIIEQYKGKKYKPDIIIDVGRLPKRKPSTLVKITGSEIEIVRPGPVSKKQIQNAL
jgi:L-threonylcarbamoyladenylate synthase